MKLYKAYNRYLKESPPIMVKKGELMNSLANCIVACESCYSACFEEPNIKNLTRCIKMNRDCIEMCMLVMGFVARNSSEAASVVRTCAELCSDCADECEKHDHVHCKECADACRECEERCLTYMNQTEEQTA